MAEARYAGRGGEPRPLEGPPVAVKEETKIAGQRHTLGSLPLREVVAEQTSAFGQRIIDAGGIVHARTTTLEFWCMPVSRGLTAPWQSILRADLKEFWADMADRARGSGTDEDRD